MCKIYAFLFLIIACLYVGYFAMGVLTLDFVVVFAILTCACAHINTHTHAFVLYLRTFIDNMHSSAVNHNMITTVRLGRTLTLIMEGCSTVHVMGKDY